MYQIISLTKRNLKVFLKDKTAVFFSFLSIIILITLYFLFINSTFASSFEGFDINSKLKDFLITSQMMGGVLVLNTLTLSLGMLGTMVTDNYTKKTDSFLVTPVSRFKITLSYLLSTVLGTFALTLFMLLITLIYLVIVTGYIYSFLTIITIIGLLFLYTLISTTFMILLVTFIDSVNAFGAISGIFGTLVGFTSGIYMPLAILPAYIGKFSSVLPFTHMTILLKSVMLKKPFDLLVSNYNIPNDTMLEIKDGFGVLPIGILGNDLNMWFIFLFIGILTVGLFFLSLKRISKKRKN